MKSIIIFGLSLLITFLLSQFTNLKPTINYSNKFEYIPIITANIYADLLIVFMTFSLLIYNSKTLTEWYKKYRLSAMTADILIGVLYILLARYLVYKFNIQPSLFQFALIAVGVQLIFDFLFYIFFSLTPIGSNHMLDFFKRYAKDVGYNALLGDSILVLFAVVVSAFLNGQSFDVNMISLIVSIYLVPYIIYMKN
jgi:hypothetical protein|tara:strand:- start:765 stop:1352 length:588 start_codon:yes stop_codon:yes gene_type:complete